MTGNDLPETCRSLFAEERSRFERDYREHFIQGESHPSSIGEPYLLYRPESRTGVLLIHGFMAAPHEVRQWADDLFEQGLTVYAPRLAGHGTSARDLEPRTRHEWIDSVDRGRRILSTLCDRLIVAGFSTGAGLALHQTICHPDRYRAVISVSAPLRFKGLASRLSQSLEHWNRLCFTCRLATLAKPYAVNHPDNPHINYHRCPIKGYNQVKALMKSVYRGLPTVTMPALIIQGSHDPKVDPRSGPMIYDRMGSSTKIYREVNHDCHGIVRGHVARDVFAEVREFLSRLDTCFET